LSYQIIVVPRAEKDLRKLTSDMIARVKESVLALREEPRPAGSRKLVNVSPETWRVRVGDWRVFYRIDDHAHVVTVTNVTHRREAYR
jgi:mRNA interferase RelE/StbE